jgi:MoaE-MoaD fusion protein
VHVTVRYFAIARELLGRSVEIRDVRDQATVDDLMRDLEREQPRLGHLRRSLMFMVNEEYASAEQTLNEGDEVALIPPVSGGEAKRFLVTDQPINESNVSALVASARSGAVVTFAGVVRNAARGREVVALDYEAYAPAAERMLRRIGDEIRERWSVEDLAIVHRTGLLDVGETSVVIAVASAHRAEAFDACRYAIDRIKQIVPIWKKEHYQDGEVWIGSEADYQAAFGHSTPQRPSAPLHSNE